MLFRSTDLLNDFERLTKGLNFGPEFEKTVDDLSTAFSGAFANSTNSANIDAVRSAERFELFVDLPGVDPSTVELTIDGRKLTISATRDFAVGENQQLLHAGRRHGSFTRSFVLADDLDAEALTARSEHGVLIVSVPVIASPEPRKIEISIEQ